MADLLLRATAAAVAAAKRRSDTRVEPDDLLLGGLQTISAFGVVQLGPLTIDLADYPAPPTLDGAAVSGPSYSDQSAALFDRASAIARADHQTRVRLAHLLAAISGEDSELMRSLQERYEFTHLEWRAAVAAWDREQDTDREARLRRAPVVLMSVEEAATALGVHQQTIRGYIRGGKLTAYRIAGERAIRVFADDLYGLLEPLEPTASEEEEET